MRKFANTQKLDIFPSRSATLCTVFGTVYFAYFVSCCFLPLNFAFLRHRVEVIPQMCSPEAGVLLPSLLWLAAVWTLAVVPPADSVRPPRYRTLYACEGSSLQITCEEGTHINLIRANFGRFSISVCNDNGNVDWSVDCMSHRSFRVMQERYF